MKRQIKHAIRAALLSPVAAPLTRFVAGRCTCLMYHRIASGSARGREFFPNGTLFVFEEEFEKQMRFLSENYECLSLDEAVTMLEQATLPRRSVVVTFDDGYRDNLLALPSLRRYRVPATIFVTTGAVGRTRSLWWDEQEHILSRLSRLDVKWRGEEWQFDLSTPAGKAEAFTRLNRTFKAMNPPDQDELMELLRDKARQSEINGPLFEDETILSWDEILEFDRDELITIGAHTADHFVLSRLSDDELRAQLITPKRELESRLGHPVDHFAYPFGGAGEAGPREFAATRDAGFRSAVTTRPGHWSLSSRAQMHALPRIWIDSGDTLEDFRWKLSGLDLAVNRPLRLFDQDANTALAVAAATFAVIA
jgi:peptidoglycan/xylan/chitin deacetylase (PgdA/CDA1 family)